MSAEQIAGQARQFASREYLHALYKGDRMTAEERTKAVADLARLTGLSKAFIMNNNLRITLRPLQRRADARSASWALPLRRARDRLPADAGRAVDSAVAGDALALNSLLSIST